MTGQAIRKSLRGPAKREIVQIGPSASVEDKMERPESTFGTVASGMSVLQEFYSKPKAGGNSSRLGSTVRRNYAERNR